MKKPSQLLYSSILFINIYTPQVFSAALTAEDSPIGPVITNVNAAASSILTSHTALPSTLVPNDAEIGQQADRLQRFILGLKQGMEDEEASYKPKDIDAIDKKANDVASGLKGAVNIASAAAPTGGAAIGEIGGSIVDIGTLIVKAIVKHHEATKGDVYGKLTKLLTIASVKREESITQEFDGLPVEVTRAYSDIIMRVLDKDSSSQFSYDAGRRIINYILAPDLGELQAYKIWSTVLRGMIMWGVDYDPAHPSPSDEQFNRYGRLATAYFADRAVSTDKPKAKTLAKAHEAIKMGILPPKRTATYAAIASSLRATGGPKVTYEYPNPYFYGFMENLGPLLDVASEAHHTVTTFGPTISGPALFALQPMASTSTVSAGGAYAHPTLKDKIRLLPTDLRERLFLRIIENPNEKELKLLGYFINKELVRSLDIHSYVKLSYILDDEARKLHHHKHRASQKISNAIHKHGVHALREKIRAHTERKAAERAVAMSTSTLGASAALSTNPMIKGSMQTAAAPIQNTPSGLPTGPSSTTQLSQPVEYQTITDKIKDVAWLGKHKHKHRLSGEGTSNVSNSIGTATVLPPATSAPAFPGTAAGTGAGSAFPEPSVSFIGGAYAFDDHTDIIWNGHTWRPMGRLEDSIYGKRLFVPHIKYPDFPSEIDLLNEMRASLTPARVPYTIEGKPIVS